MKFLQFRGSGLPNVYLADGYRVEQTADGPATAYADVDGLYRSLASSIAKRSGGITGFEFRFLRRRLGFSQSQVGKRVGKTDQAIAMWEKRGQLVPKAEGDVLRYLWLAEFEPRSLRGAVQVGEDAEHGPAQAYLLSLVDGKWRTEPDHEAEAAAMLNAAAPTAVAIENASQRESRYTFGPSAQMVTSDLIHPSETEMHTT